MSPHPTPGYEGMEALAGKLASRAKSIRYVTRHGNYAYASAGDADLLDAAAAAIREAALSTPTPPAADAMRIDCDFAWVVPRHPTEAMMNAGLYHCSADMTWGDLFTAFHSMVDAAEEAHPALGADGGRDG